METGAGFIQPQNKPSSIFTVNDLTEEQRIITETIRSFVAEKLLTPEAIKAIESQNFAYSRQILEELAALGFLGMEIPEQYGGTGLDKIASALVTAEIAAQGSFACTFGAHTGIGSWPIIFFGNEEQKKKYLPRMATGELIAAYSLTEAGAGSDAAAIRTTAELSADGRNYVLTGEKLFVTNGGLADLFIVFAQIKGKGPTAFIVEKIFPGLKVGSEEHKMGIRGSSTAALILEETMVPVENLLGEPGRGLKIAFNVLNLGRFKLGAGCLGAARLSLATAWQYAQERKQFNQPLISFGLIRQKLAQMAMDIFAMEAVVCRTAALLEESISQIDSTKTEEILKTIEKFAIECSIVKVFGSEALARVVNHEVQIFGGNGFCEEFSAARRYRDARINLIFEGSNEINRLVIVKELLKKQLELSLLTLIQRCREEAESASWRRPLTLESSPTPTVKKLLFFLNNAKKAVLIAGGTVFETFAHQSAKEKSPLLKVFNDHQLVTAMLSDSLINCYVLDSALAVLAKSETEKNQALTLRLFAQLLPETKTAVEDILGCCGEGRELLTALSVTNKLFGRFLFNKERLIEAIIQQLK